MLVEFNNIIKRLLWIAVFIGLPFLYSEEAPQVNQLHTSNYQFDVDESIPTVETNPVEAKLLAEETGFQAGQPFWIAVQLKLEDHWHLYWKNPGDSGMPISVEWQLPAGFTATDLEWPYPNRFEQDSLVGFGYEREVQLLAKITPPVQTPSENYTFKADIKYLVCSDSACLPGEASAQLNMPVASGASQANVAAFAHARSVLPQASKTVHAQRVDDLIELSLNATDLKKEFVSAYFAPDKGQSIDFHQEALVSGNSVALKEQDILARKNSQLQGVLVLKASDGSVEAIEVNVPIFDRTGNISQVAMADPVKKGLDISLPEQEEELNFGLALLLAFVGGMILNLMPCVLPVLSFKILSFVKLAGQSRRLTFQHGLSFSAGVMASFWTLAGVFLAMQAYGHAVGWGFQLQEPIFVGVLAVILLIFSLSMFGLFEMGTKLGAVAGQMQHETKQEGFTSSFLSGILATLIATPCTGPFLGTVIGLAMTLPYYLSFLIFTAMGFGMAFPYLLLTAYPQLMKFLPKPGNWMVVFKQLMGFLMLASVLWLVWVFGAQTSSNAVTMLLGAFFLVSLACWIYGQWGSPIHSKRSRILSTATAVVLLITSFYVMAIAADDSTSPANKEQIASADETWEAFSPERLKELKEKGIPVFVDFTAKWCLICQTNHMVLSAAEIENKFNELGVVRMKADWTKKDPVITAELKKFGRNSVPLYVLYDGDDNAKILPQVLTPHVVLDHLKD